MYKKQDLTKLSLRELQEHIKKKKVRELTKLMILNIKGANCFSKSSAIH